MAPFRRSIGALLRLVVVASVLRPAPASGSVNLSGEFAYDVSETDTTDKSTGTVTESESAEFRQRYNLDLSRNIFPKLILRGGGILSFADLEATSDGTTSESDTRTAQPFLELNLSDPLYGAGVTYRKTDTKTATSSAPATRNFREEYSASLTWRPIGFPRFAIFANRSYTYDEPKTADLVDSLASASVNYHWRKLSVNYSYVYNESENRVNDFQSVNQTHQGRLGYSREFLDRRLAMDTGYVINMSTSEFSGEGSGTIFLSRSGGLASLDDTPEDGPALEPNPALIDGNRNASSGIDLGLDGDETTLTNIGLDLGFPATVATLFVWVDRRVPADIAASFVWLIFVSSENTGTSAWTLHATVPAAPFGILDDRFAIAFPPVDTRFIKVVTRPLSQAVTLDQSFRNIFVTELEAFAVVSGGAELTSVDHNYNLRLNGRVGPKTSLGYSLFFRLREDANLVSERTTRFANTFDVRHAFSDVFLGTADITREDSSLEDRNTTRYTYSASVRAAYLATLRQTLSYTGTHVEEAGASSTSNSLFLRTNADLYRGWSVFLDLGSNWDTLEEGTRRTGRVARTGMEVVPNDRIRMTSTYFISTTQESGVGAGPSTTRQRADVTVFCLPVRTLSLFAQLSYEDAEAAPQTFQNYSITWSPFPEGALQFSVLYNERFNSVEDQRDRIIAPGLRWNVARGIFLDVTYNIVDSDSVSVSRNTKSLNTRLSYFF